MTTDKLPAKVGIIGCGNMAKIHLRLLLKYVDKKNIAICDNTVFWLLGRCVLMIFLQKWG